MRLRAKLRRKGDLLHNATVVELSAWDMIRLMFGREVCLWAHNELVLIRLSPNYEAFRLSRGGERETG
jgi:hypothetical protein